MKELTQMSRQNSSETPEPWPNMLSVNDCPPTTHRPIPAPDPDPEPNPAPDNVKYCMTSKILLADWSVLFCALQERLEQYASNDMLEHVNALPSERYERVNITVLRCASDMKLLCLEQPEKLLKA